MAPLTIPQLLTTRDWPEHSMEVAQGKLALRAWHDCALSSEFLRLSKTQGVPLTASHCLQAFLLAGGAGSLDQAVALTYPGR